MSQFLTPNQEHMLYCQLATLVSQEEWEARKEKIRQESRIYYMRTHSVEVFLESEGFFRYDPAGKITSKELYELYLLWCETQEIFPQTQRSFCCDMKALAPGYNLCYSTNIPLPDGKHARGFLGLAKTVPAGNT